MEVAPSRELGGSRDTGHPPLGAVSPNGLFEQQRKPGVSSDSGLSSRFGPSRLGPSFSSEAVGLLLVFERPLGRAHRGIAPRRSLRSLMAGTKAGPGRGGWLCLATGYWLLATGDWRLATGYWLLANGYLATRYWLLPRRLSRFAPRYHVRFHTERRE